MAGFFRDPTDANRKPRGVRPFAGQKHEPGTGPLKGNPVRRQTLAPFKSPFADPVESRRVTPPSPSPVDTFEPAEPENTPAPQSVDATATPAAGISTSEVWPEPQDETVAAEAPPSPALNTLDLQRNDEPGQDAQSTWLQSITELEPAPSDEAQDDWFADADAASLDAEASVVDEEGLDTTFESFASLEAPQSYDWASDDLPIDNDQLLMDPKPGASDESEVDSGTPGSQLPLSPDWAVSPDAEADFHAYTARLAARERASEVIEAVARRVRSGEIVVAIEPGATTEAVLASVLTTLLTNST